MPSSADPTTLLLLGLLGLIIGGFGTLIGAGGGFLLLPLLVLLYPHEEPRVLASISLAVVCINAISGSIGYARQRLINYRAGWVFVACGIPGAILGALITARISRMVFDLWLGGLLVLVAIFLILAGPTREPSTAAAPLSPPVPVPHARTRGGILSFFVGFISSLLGIGGGIVHVPILVYVLRFPVHVAAATSHFVLAFTALAGTLIHIAGGDFHSGHRRTIALGIGVALGAQIGARLAKRTPSGIILRGLGIALAVVGVRVVYQAVNPLPPHP